MHTRFAQSPLGYFGGLSLLVLVPQAVALNNFTISNFTSVFLENRITTFSGVNSPEPPNLTYINWSYSLDLSESVQTNKPTWENDAVSRVGAPQVQSAAAVAVTVPSGPSVFLYGGDCRPTDVGNSSLFIYSWKDQDWSRPTVSIPRRYSPSAVWAPKYNRIVYFGGSRVTDKCGSTYEATDDLVFMDPVSLSISTSSVTDSRPTPRFGHRAVMLDDDRMAIIGGYGNVRTAANRVYVYHLGLDRWAYQDLDGIDFSNFINFSAVVRNGKVIMVGGYLNAPSDSFSRGISVLDTTANPWTFSTVDNKDLAYGRISGGLTLVGNYLFVYFGYPEANKFDQLVILDADSLNSVDIYSPDQAGTIVDTSLMVKSPTALGASGSDSSSASLSVGAIVGIAVGGGVLLIILGAFVWWFFFRRIDGGKTRFGQLRRKPSGLGMLDRMGLWKDGQPNHFGAYGGRKSSENRFTLETHDDNTKVGSPTGTNVSNHASTGRPATPLRNDSYEPNLGNMMVQTVLVPRPNLKVVNHEDLEESG